MSTFTSQQPGIENTTLRTEQIIAEFESHESAEEAIKHLVKAEFEVKNLTIMGQNYHTEEHPIGFVNTGERMMTWGKLGMFWGSIWGILFGSAVLFVPGVGQIVFAGWLATALVGAIEGAVVGGGFAALGAALTSVGVPKDSVVRYETAIKAGSFLVIVRGTGQEVERARYILTDLGGKGLEVSEHLAPSA